MNRLLIISLSTSIVVASCGAQPEKEDLQSEKTDSVKVHSITLTGDEITDSIDYFSKAEEFSKYVLGDNLRVHELNSINIAPSHIEIFST